MAIAYFLDQTKSLSGFVEDDIVDIIDCAVLLADRFGLLTSIARGEFHNQLVAIGLGKRRWSTDEKLKHAQFSPLDWWSLANRFQGFKEFATHILSIPTSSAASERTTWGEMEQ
uniref:HAT C-terminal dimerisation domain-containing protein n=1 Tax=Globisporangium ultimum (strain ATCC 200006 / CBS 805.95 / DAOM BR144) TaxID=431595 RepID=K3WDP3_GLOUD